MAAMPATSSPEPQLMPGPHVLDDLELVRQGVPVPLRICLPAGLEQATEVVLIEPEGVPLAQVSMVADEACGETTGAPRWLAARPERPFEVWHRAVADTPAADVTVLLDPATSPDDVVTRTPEGASVLLVLAASVERDGAAEPIEVEACRRWVSVLPDLQPPAPGPAGIALTVVPVSWDHPERADRLRACATAYARGGEVIDLTESAPTPAATGPGAVLFFTGLSGSGKSTLARAVRNRLLERTDRSVTLLDGDVVRRHLSAGLGFGAADRDTNIRRIGWVAARIAEHGGLAICSPIAPFAATRGDVQQMVERAGAQFALVHVATPLAECERRDRKGLYARARRGEIPEFTGISSPYEEPENPDLRLDTTGRDTDDLADQILDLGVGRSWWSRTDDDAG